jgi:CGNR zinc finger
VKDAPSGEGPEQRGGKRGCRYNANSGSRRASAAADTAKPDRACGWVFIDRSRNHSRRWYSSPTAATGIEQLAAAPAEHRDSLMLGGCGHRSPAIPTRTMRKHEHPAGIKQHRAARNPSPPGAALHVRVVFRSVFPAAAGDRSAQTLGDGGRVALACPSLACRRSFHLRLRRQTAVLAHHIGVACPASVNVTVVRVPRLRGDPAHSPRS